MRKEYAWVPQETFAQRRAEILEAFLSRPTIFLTPEFQERYERSARKNIDRSLAQLQRMNIVQG